MIVEAGEWRQDLLEENLDELESLISRRPGLLRSDEHRLPQLQRHDERLSAHLDALVLAGTSAYGLLVDALEADDASRVCAAATALFVQREDDGLQALVQRMPSADGAVLEGLIHALRFAPLQSAASLLAPLRSKVNPALAGAIHWGLDSAGIPPPVDAWQSLVTETSPLARQLGWALAANTKGTVDRKQLEDALLSKDRSVHRAALVCAVFQRQKWVMSFLREMVAQGSPPLQMAEALAVLGGPEDLEPLLKWAAANPDVPERFSVLGTFAHPGVVEALLEGMLSGSALSSAEAARAFRRLTGVDVSTDVRVPAPREAQPTEEDKAVAELVPVPDAARARQVWGSMNGTTTTLKSAKLIRSGRPVNLGNYQPLFGELDLKSLQELGLRAQYEGTWSGNPRALEAFTGTWPEREGRQPWASPQRW